MDRGDEAVTSPLSTSSKLQEVKKIKTAQTPLFYQDVYGAQNKEGYPKRIVANYLSNSINTAL